MSSLLLFPDRLEYWTLDADKRNKYKTKKDGKQWQIIDVITQAVTFVETEEKAYRVFNSKLEIQCIWMKLTELIYVEEHATLSDLIKIIKSDCLFASVMYFFFSLWEDIDQNESNEPAVLSRRLICKDGKVEMEYRHSGGIGEIILNETIPVTVNDAQVHDPKTWWTLMEVLQAVFSKYRLSYQELIFQKEGLFDLETGEFIDDPMGVLLNDITVESNVTLQNVMNYVQSCPMLTEFLRFYATCFNIDEFHNELKFNPNLDNVDEDKLDYLFTNKYIKINRRRDNQPWYIVYHGADFHGFGQINGEKQSCAVEFTPLQELKHLPYKLDNNVKIIQGALWSRPGQPKESMKVLYEGEWKFNLLEMLESIYDEISVATSPEQRDAMRLDIKGRLEEYEKENGINESCE